MTGPSAQNKQNSIPEFTVPATDVVKLRASDASRKQAKGVQQFAVAQEVDISPDTHGEWTPNSGRICLAPAGNQSGSHGSESGL